MRIVHITAARRAGQGSTFGGLERFFEEIIPAQRALGLEVGVLEVAAEALSAAADAISRHDWIGVSEIGCDLLGTANADIFHLHDWYGSIAFEHLYRRGCRALVVSSHLPLRRGFTYRDTGLGWQAKSIIENRCLQAAPVITAPSNYAKRFLIEEYGLSGDRLNVVPHGVDCSTFSPCGGPFIAEPPRLLAVGRLTEQKGFELLIRAFPLVLTTEPAARLTIVGDGGRRAALSRMIADLNLAGIVTILDAKSKPELARIFSDTTLLIIPSQFEPFGLVGLEAMACGCPVLAIAPTGASEYLESEELTNSYSIARLAQAICRRIQALRQQQGPRSLVRLRAREWSWERAASAYRDLYSGCIG